MRRLLVMAAVIAATLVLAGETAWAGRFLGCCQRSWAGCGGGCCQVVSNCCMPVACQPCASPVPACGAPVMMPGGPVQPVQPGTPIPSTPPAIEPTPASPSPGDKPEAKPEENPAAPEKNAGTGPLRLWIDATGNHHVVARFVRAMADGTVRLQRLDGGFVRVARDRLSEVDRRYVAERDTAIASR